MNLVGRDITELHTGGGWFTDRQEQQALLDFMKKTDQCSGWPRKHAQQALMDEWGWETRQV